MSTRYQRGSALLITLMMVSLITILLVGFVSSMQTEILSSRNHMQGIQAGFYSSMGRNAAMAQLGGCLTNSTLPWLSAPGMIGVYSGSKIITNSLSSGFVVNSSNDNDTVNLNTAGFDDSTQLAIATIAFFPAGDSQMRVRWIYVDKTGAYSTSSSSSSVGRFAFWVDDESAKVNLNTAWRRIGNTNSPAHPSQLDLTALGFTSSGVDGINASRATNIFNGIDDLRRIYTASTDAVSTNAFNLTPYNHSPNLNFFGDPKIILTTHKSLAGTSTNFLDILTSDTADPGKHINLDSAKVEIAVNKIITYLQRTDWPLPSLAGKSFKNKYTSDRAVAQIALNIIEYVRCRESETECVEPIFGTVASGKYVWSATRGTGTIVGNTRGARIVQADSKIDTTAKTADVKMVVHLPKNFGLASVDLSKFLLAAVMISSDGDPTHYKSITITPSNTINVGDTYTFHDVSSVISNFDVSTITKCRFSLQPISSDPNAYMTIVPSATDKTIAISPTTSSYYTVGIDDPCVGANAADWIAAKTFVNTNSESISSSIVASVPQQDTNSAGSLTGTGVRFPPPKGKQYTYTDGSIVNNSAGIMESVAELGFVHTGMGSSSPSSIAGVPWRTLRLQPQNSATYLPDWLMLDLFDVPQVNTNSFVVTDYGPGGKVNLNSAVMPFVNSSGTALVNRVGPIKAALINATSSGTTVLNDSQASTLAANLSNYTLATGSNAGRTYNLPKVYITPGQMAEIDGVTSGGEASEAQLRSIMDQFTTRSGVFSVYSVGQVIRWISSSNIQILGEQRNHSVMELSTDFPPKLRVLLSEDLSR